MLTYPEMFTYLVGTGSTLGVLWNITKNVREARAASKQGIQNAIEENRQAHLALDNRIITVGNQITLVDTEAQLRHEALADRVGAAESNIAIIQDRQGGFESRPRSPGSNPRWQNDPNYKPPEPAPVPAAPRQANPLPSSAAPR